MAISKTENETYRLRLYYPQDIQEMIGVSKLYSKTFTTRKEAKEAEIDFYAKIKELRENKEKNAFELGGEALFKDFYEDIWIDAHTAGLTSRNTKSPTPVTITNTKDIFRLHILPMFGKYTLNYLNQNKVFVLKIMTQKATEYANFKILRSYVNSIFDWAEELEYIERNKLEKSLKRINATKKNQLQEATKEDLYLSFDQLQEWLTAVQSDYESGQLILQDYVLFLTTFFDDKGNINQRLHTDYLNYRMKSIERRHKHLTHAPPHKLRHTGATLAKQAGVALEQISEALTHSDTNITRTYVNTPNVIQMPIGEIAYRKLSQKESDRNGVNSKKDASQSELRNA